MPNMMCGFCKEEIIFTADGVKQKYQNLYQICPGACFIYMVVVVHIPADHAPAATRAVLGSDQAIVSELQNPVSLSGYSVHFFQLGH